MKPYEGQLGAPLPCQIFAHVYLHSGKPSAGHLQVTMATGLYCMVNELGHEWYNQHKHSVMLVCRVQR